MTQQNYRPVTFKAFAQDKCFLNHEVCLKLDRKFCGKRRKCISLFPQMFSKGFSLRVVKSWDCEVTGEALTGLEYVMNVLLII